MNPLTTGQHAHADFDLDLNFLAEPTNNQQPALSLYRMVHDY